MGVHWSERVSESLGENPSTPVSKTGPEPGIWGCGAAWGPPLWDQARNLGPPAECGGHLDSRNTGWGDSRGCLHQVHKELGAQESA